VRATDERGNSQPERVAYNEQVISVSEFSIEQSSAVRDGKITKMEALQEIFAETSRN
jgi:hypothetical protein